MVYINNSNFGFPDTGNLLIKPSCLPEADSMKD